jgi:hypothetical protein
MAIHFGISLSNPNIAISEFFDQVLGRNAISNEDAGILDVFRDFFTAYTLGIKRLYILLFEIGVLVLGLILMKRSQLLGFLALLGLLNFVLSMMLFSPYSSRHFGEVMLFSILAFPLILNLLKETKLISIGFLILGVIYLLNSAAGDAYLVYSKYNNTPYTEVEKFLEEEVPENSVVVTSLHLWFPVRDSEIYNEYTRYHYKPYESLTDLFEKDMVDYVVYSDVWTEGITGTSGRAEDVPEDTRDFFEEVEMQIETRGELVAELETKGYNRIQVFTLKPNP